MFFQAPFQGGAEIFHFVFRLVERGLAFAGMKYIPRRIRKSIEIGKVPVTRRRGLLGFEQLFPGVLPDRLEHEITHLVVAFFGHNQ